jgi:hypothetical protein
MDYPTIRVVDDKYTHTNKINTNPYFIYQYSYRK